MEGIFTYILDQFYTIYQPGQTFDISYGLGSSGQIQISRTTTSFFEQTQAHPGPPSVYLNWSGASIPFWFMPQPVTEIITFSSGKAIIHADIIANAFYFLSGWQEYYSPARDKYGRFPFSESLQSQYQLITIPIVNYYFDILKTAIEIVYPVKLKSVLAREGAFTTCLTHDIDNCESAWLVEGMVALRQGKWRTFLQLVNQKLTRRDNWFNLPEVMQLVQLYQARSTCFFLANKNKYQGIANADYDILKPKYQAWVEMLRQNNFEIAIHGSHVTAFKSGKLQEEISKIKQKVRGNRFHYLRFEPKITPYLLDEAALNYDSTLGFSEHFGFRHGTCFPFQLFNFKTRQPFKFLEIPLNLMDATLHHPNYLQLQSQEILPAISPMVQEINKFGGCFTWLWHNENFSANNQLNGPAAFYQIMSFLQQEKADFITTGEVSTLLKIPGRL